MVALLQLWPGDSIDLTKQSQQAHRNVKGRHFMSLHELFDKVCTDTGLYVDLIAERIVQLSISNGHMHVAELVHAIDF